MRKIFYNRGVSLMEVLIVFAVFSVLLAIILPEFSKSRETQTLHGAVGDVLSALNQARSQTLSSLESSSYGIRFEPDKVIIFKGTNFSAADPDNKEISIVSPAGISSVTLNGTSGSTGDFYFYRMSGRPSKSGTVTVSSPSFSKTITITATGSASAN